MRIIFHHPLPLNSDAKSASGIRPRRMLEAFNELGYTVDIVAGYAADRRQRIEKIKKNIKEGIKYDFVYSESSTMPTTLTEPHHLPLNPFLDWLFFWHCNKKKIPIGLFYRDIYWRFRNYGENLNPIKEKLAKAAYHFDLWVYQRTLTKLYLPSLEMGNYVPRVSPTAFASLPPGHNSPEFDDTQFASQQPFLKLFYVGGISSRYKLHTLIQAVTSLNQIELTVCTRKKEWLAVKHEYPQLTSNIHFIHEVGSEMESYLRACHVAVLFVEPQEYWNFSSPVKLYEYLGYQKPILASEGTLAGRFVEENGIGWAIPYNVDEIKTLLSRLSSNPDILHSIKENLKKVAPSHSWNSRAQKVVDDLASPYVSP